MELDQIKANLHHDDYQYRLKAISALKDYAPDVAIPLLLQTMQDSEFLVRTFVARELGRHRTADSFSALLEIARFDNTPNVRAEAANSISLFGQVSAPHLVQLFYQDDHWLVRRSILPALIELECPEELLDVCGVGLQGEDTAVQEASIDSLATLARTRQADAALQILLPLADHAADYIRVRVAYALKPFDTPAAKAALARLRQDNNHRVVGAAMEDLLS